MEQNRRTIPKKETDLVLSRPHAKQVSLNLVNRQFHIKIPYASMVQGENDKLKTPASAV